MTKLKLGTKKLELSRRKLEGEFKKIILQEKNYSNSTANGSLCKSIIK